MPTKKNFTKADGAIDKFFTSPKDEISAQNADASQDVKAADVTNKPSRFGERGKRAERFGLLLDEQLKSDLKYLSMAKGSKSINDFVVTILLEYVEREENQIKLEQYLKLLKS